MLFGSAIRQPFFSLGRKTSRFSACRLASTFFGPSQPCMWQCGPVVTPITVLHEPSQVPGGSSSPLFAAFHTRWEISPICPNPIVVPSASEQNTAPPVWFQTNGWTTLNGFPGPNTGTGGRGGDPVAFPF